MDTLQELPLYGEDEMPDYDKQISNRTFAQHNGFNCFYYWCTGQTHFLFQDYNILIGDFKHILCEYHDTIFAQDEAEEENDKVPYLMLNKYIFKSSCNIEQLTQQVSAMMNYTFDPSNFVASHQAEEYIIQQMVQSYSLLPYSFIYEMRKCGILKELVDSKEDPDEVLKELRSYDSSELTNKRFAFCLFFVIYKIIRDVRCIPEQLIKKFDCDWKLFQC
jgi:hypothetical protein